MKKVHAGLMFGVAAGILDVVPMFMQKLSFDADISAFSMWVVSGFFISVINLKIHYILKGILIPFCVLLPCAVLIGWKEPVSLIPICIMTLILGAGLGFAIEKLGKKEG